MFSVLKCLLEEVKIKRGGLLFRVLTTTLVWACIYLYRKSVLIYFRLYKNVIIILDYSHGVNERTICFLSVKK